MFAYPYFNIYRPNYRLLLVHRPNLVIMSEAHHPNPPPKGSAEYLSLKLTGEDFSCPHPDKLIPGVQSKIPARLGFFHVTLGDTDISYLDTAKLCQTCYGDVVPGGFLTWSCFYMKPDINVYSSEEEYPNTAPVGVLPHAFPAQVQAGTERFFERHLLPIRALKVPSSAGYIYYNGKHYSQRRALLPKNGEPRLVWEFLQWAKQPFYIDILHLDPPWEAKNTEEAQLIEDRRVARANAAAYIGARYIINGVPEGGWGPYTVAEQRLGQMGSYRLVPLTLYGQKLLDAKQHAPDTMECADSNYRVGINRNPHKFLDSILTF